MGWVHRLTDRDPERECGVCAECGPTPIFRDSNGTWRCGSRRTGKRWVHRLSNVDVDARTAVCAACGPTRLRAKGPGRWGCRNAQGEQETRNRWKREQRGKGKGDRCERCGFVPEDPCQLDIHHRDGNHANDAPENRETLCANCHRLEHCSTTTKGAPKSAPRASRP